MGEPENRAGKKLLSFFVIVVLVLFSSLGYSLYSNLNYLSPLSNILYSLRVVYSPIDLTSLPQLLFAILQVILVGTILASTVLPTRVEDSESRLVFKVASIGFGVALVGAIVTVLSCIRLLTLLPMEVAVLGAVAALVLFQRMRLGEAQFKEWARSLATRWQVKLDDFSPAEVSVLAALGILAALVYYDSVFYPVSETDSIIYHSSMAAIAFYAHGLPLITGAGLGLSTSANYPLLFSYMGTYYYVIVGHVQDTFLKLVAPTMWAMTVLTTFVAGRTLGRRLASAPGRGHGVGTPLGAISAVLIMSVPSFVSYAYQTTDETTITFFVALGFLFLVRSLDSESQGESAAAGLAFGAACLTSYQALYFVIPLLLVVGWYPWRRKESGPPGGGFARNSVIMLTLLLLIGSAPYVRNLVVLHDPVYPFFTWLFPARDFSAALFSETVSTWQYVAYSLVSPSSPTSSSFWSHLATYASFYPLNPLLVIPSLLVIPMTCLRRKPMVVAFLLVPTALVLFLLVPFVRYFWLVLPYAAIATGAMLAAAQAVIVDWVKKPRSIRSPLGRPAPLLKLFIPIWLISLMVFPSMAIFGNNNYTFIPFGYSYSPQQYFSYFNHPGISANTVLTNDYGTDASSWAWLSQHYRAGRIATFESRVYYMGFALRNPGSIFYLDASYALPLYGLTNEKDIVSFMKSQNVTLILVRSEDWGTSQLDSLSFSRMLGSPSFPLLWADGTSDVFGVGLSSVEPDPLVAHSPDHVYDYGLTSSVAVEGQTARTVPELQTTPKLFVQTNSSLVSLTIQYLDSGNGSLALNAYDPATKGWVYGASIQKTGSSLWKNYTMIVPTNLVDAYTEFGLYASGGDFTISRLYATSVVMDGRSTAEEASGVPISNSTSPKSAIIYLPLLGPGETLSVATSTGRYNVSLEIFRGYTPLGVATDWWLSQEDLARVPANTTATRVTSPSLIWSPPALGYYTLIVASWDPQVSSDITIRLTIDIGSSSSAGPQGIPFG